MLTLYQTSREFLKAKKNGLSQRLKDYINFLKLVFQHRWAIFFRPRFTSQLISRYLKWAEGGAGDDFHPFRSHPSFSKILEAKKISMLHQEVLALLYFFVISSRGRVLEIGSYIGGSTVIMATAAQKYKKPPIISIEPGGYLEHSDYPSHDIFTDFKKNIKSFGLTDFVYPLNNFSHRPEVIQEVKDIVGSEGIDLLFIDADGQVERDIEIYSSLLMDGAVLVLDDYSSTLAPEKALLVKQWVEKAVSEGRVVTLGVWGWGTWIGLYVKQPQ